MLSSSSTLLSNTTNTKKKRKKIVIRPFAKPPQVPPDFYETRVKHILESTKSILSKNQSPNLQHAFRSVQDLCQHKYGGRLYTDLVKSIRDAAETVLPEYTSTTSLLQYVPQQYSVYTDYLSVVRHVFLPLDRQYVWNGTEGVLRSISSESNATLWQAGLQVFLERLKQLNLDEGLYESWWQQLWGDYKEPSSLYRKELMDTMLVWHELGLKAQILKTKLQPQLIQFLQRDSTLDNPEKFVSYVYEKWIHVSHNWTFLPRTWVRTLVEVEVVQPHLSKLLECLDITSVDHVFRLWTLTLRLPEGSPQMQEAICRHAKTRGQLVMQQTMSIQGLLELQDQLQLLEKRLGTSLALKSVWMSLMGEPQAAEALAKYMDASFKSSRQAPQLESLLQLFVHLQAKDVFEAFYKKDLAKRLLGGRVQNMDLERQWVSLLKSECGTGFTSKMEGMFQDVLCNRETMARYTPPAGIDLDVQVLTTGYWPVYPNYALLLPECLEKPQNHFIEYYKKTYQGRRIAWQYSLGHVTIKAQFSEKTYDLVMGLGLALVVLCFNNSDQKWTLPELSKKVGLDDRSEMERILKTLSLGKVKLLQKWDHDAQQLVPQKPRADVHDEDWFTINDEFSSPLKKIKISSIAKSDAKEDRAKVIETVSQDRLYLLDAILVRVMKARKTMMHSDLIPLVLEHAKVPVTPTDVKHRIESLIEREYLERDANDRNRYNYLA
jgi:cullin-4